MKKLITLLAVFLIGTASVFAQDAWEVLVEWDFQPPYYCLSELSDEYGFAIELDIYDVANSEQITVTPTYNLEDWDETETLFDETQAKVKDYCEDSHDNTPSFKVTFTVAIYHLTELDEYCSETDIITGKSCNDFYNGIALGVTFN